MKKETTEEHIHRVAIDIQELLVREHMALLPTISLQEVKEESPILTPNEEPAILTPEDNLMNRADFMQP